MAAVFFRCTQQRAGAVQPCAVAAVTLGMRLAALVRVLNFFMAGPEMVRWDVTAGDDGGCRLTVCHAQGTIVEYFRTVTAALLREQQLEELLMAARGAR